MYTVHAYYRNYITTNQSLELTMDSYDLTEVTELTLSPLTRTILVCNGPSSIP